MWRESDGTQSSSTTLILRFIALLHDLVANSGIKEPIEAWIFHVDGAVYRADHVTKTSRKEQRRSFLGSKKAHHCCESRVEKLDCLYLFSRINVQLRIHFRLRAPPFSTSLENIWDHASRALRPCKRKCFLETLFFSTEQASLAGAFLHNSTSQEILSVL